MNICEPIRCFCVRADSSNSLPGSHIAKRHRMSWVAIGANAMWREGFETLYLTLSTITSARRFINCAMPAKKSKKPSKLPKSLLLGIATNVAVGPLGFRAALDINPKGDRNRSHPGLGAELT